MCAIPHGMYYIYVAVVKGGMADITIALVAPSMRRVVDPCVHALGGKIQNSIRNMYL